MTSLNDFIEPDLTASDVMHTNGYAQAAAGSAISGAGADGLSLEQRREKERQRRYVAGYRGSRLGSQLSAQKARAVGQKQGRAYDASSDSFSDRAGYSIRRSTGTRGGRPAAPLPTPQRHFIEPRGRTHDPFG